MKVQKCTQTDESGVKQSSRARLRTPIPEQQRLDPAEREAIIAREAVSFFAEHGFEVLERAGYADVEPRWGLPALNIGNERVVLAVKRA